MTPIQALKKYFNYDDFRSSQLEIIEKIISKKNVLAVLPTGAGKSICYQIPALLSDDFSIVISPLIALMKDQVDSLNRTHNVAAFINSTQSYVETESVLNDIRFGKVKIVYIAPERLENTEFASRLKNLNPQYLFIDEAHCISEWGHNFRSSYTKIKDFIEFTGIKKVSAFTATATPEVVKDIIKQLGLKNVELVIKGFERNNLFVNVEITKRKKERVLELIHQHKHPAIIYAASRKNTEDLSVFLKSNKINCEYYHAGLDPIVRKKIQEDFIDDKLPVIIATNAFGMGIDKKDIRLVIHYNLPGSIENYYQEIGRAGRDGKDSHTYLLFDQNDLNIHEYFISNSYPTKEIIKAIYSAICDSGNIALNSKNEKPIPLNLTYIKQHCKHDISSAMLNSSIQYLEETGYLQLNSALKSETKIKILFEPERVKKLIKNSSNHFIKSVLLYLVRNIGNDLFKKPVAMNINQLKADTDLTSEEINETFINLENLGVIDFSKPDGKPSVSLLQPRVKSDLLKLNYKHINELYISARQKLDRINDFVYSNDCRFKFILAYFGENVNDYACGKCDNCINRNFNNDSEINYIKEKIKDLLEEAETELTENEIIDCLLGKSEDIFLSGLKMFSTLFNFTKSDLIKALKNLADENKIGSKLEGRKKIYFLYSIRYDYKNLSNEKNKNEEFADHLELFHLLRKERDKASKKFLQSPNIICPDEILIQIAKLKPKNKFEMLTITGFNERMFNKVGENFLELINDNESSVQKSQIERKTLPNNLLETYNLLNKGYKLDEIARLRKLTPAVISMQIETIISYLPETDIASVVNRDEFENIRNHYQNGITGLKELKSILSNDVDYSVLRVAIAKIKALVS